MAEADDILKDLGVTPGERVKPTAARPDTASRIAAKKAEARATRADAKTAAAPPKTEEAPRKTAPRAGTKAAARREGVAQLYTMAGMGITLAGDDIIGNAVRSIAEPAATAWGDLADKDPRVARVLDKLTTGSAWGDVAMIHGSLVVTILASKGLIPGMPGLPTEAPDAPPVEWGVTDTSAPILNPDAWK